MNDRAPNIIILDFKDSIPVNISVEVDCPSDIEINWSKAGYNEF